MSLFRKIKNVALFTGLSFPVLLSAYDREKRISELEKQMLEIGSYHNGRVFGAKLAPASPVSSDWEISFDALLWQAGVGETEYACSTTNVSATEIRYPFRGTISEISFGWDWGFRFSIGKENVYDEFDLILAYTRYFTSAKDGYRKDLPSGFFGLTGFFDPALLAKSRYKLHYQNIDLEMGKSYFITQKILVRSHIGLKTSWITQKQDSRYEFAVRSGDLLSFSSRLQDQCKFWGIGPRVGLHSRWYLCQEISLVNKIGGSLLYGYYKVQDFYESNEIQAVSGETRQTISRTDLEGSCHHFSPFAEILLGLSWNRAFYQDKIVVMATLSYETSYFWRQKEVISGEGAMRTGASPTLVNSSRVQFAKQAEDLGFRGVSFSLEVDF